MCGTRHSEHCLQSGRVCIWLVMLFVLNTFQRSLDSILALCNIASTMAPPARPSKMLRAHRHPSVETKGKLALGLTANVPVVAASTNALHHETAHDRAPNGTMGLFLVPPSGPMHMQQNLIDLNVLPILEFDPTQSQASVGIDGANVPATAHESGNLPTQSISAPSFQDFCSRARALSRGASHPESSDGAHATSNVTHGLPESDLLIGRLPKLELLTGSELPKEHPESLESAHSVSPPQQHHPNCSPESTQEAQLAIDTNTPSSATVQNGPENGSMNSESTVDDGLTAQSVRRWPQQGQANRYPERPIAARVPTSCVSIAVPRMRFGVNEILNHTSQYVTPRADHLWSQCERRMKLRDDIIRTRPPSDALKTWLEDEAKLLIEMVKQIRLCEEMEAVVVAIKHLQAVAGGTWVPNNGTDIWVPQNVDAPAMDAVTITANGTRVFQASMLSPNVTLLVNSHSCFLTTTSPQDRSSGLLDHIVSTLGEYRLEVLSVTFVTRENMIVYSVHFWIREHEQVRIDDLYSTVQTTVNDFTSASSSQGGS